MSLTIKLRCNGCHEEADGTAPIRRRFESLYGGGFGVWRTDSLYDVIPEGWIAHDPYTAMTYCPTCWASIEAGESEAPVPASNPTQGEEG